MANGSIQSMAAAGFAMLTSQFPFFGSRSGYCCTALSDALGNKVTFPSDESFNASQTSYWSALSQKSIPSCIVLPTSAEDVSTAVRVLSTGYLAGETEACQFAIRGAGHSPWGSSAGTANGVTIDLALINVVSVSEDRNIASIGAGANWGGVYHTLDPMQLAVAGGRVSSVGVGGLTTGGGVSFYSPRVGFVCNTVENYEIVLANGTITNANATHNSDLWISMKGGSNNFGVVTRFDLKAFEQGELWGGFIYYDLEANRDTMVEAFVNFNNATDYDEYAALIQVFIYVDGMGYVGVTCAEYTKPVAYPPPFAPWEALNKSVDTTRITTLADLTDEQAQQSPKGKRQLFITTTFKNDLSFLHHVYDKWNGTLQELKHISGIVHAQVVQPLPPAITGKSGTRGGNSLGLDPADGALVLWSVSATWEDSADDDLVHETSRRLVDEIDWEAQKRGLAHPYRYLNYALDGQKPIQGYGPKNVKRMLEASKKYDPQGIFQKAVPGGFKLST